MAKKGVPMAYKCQVWWRSGVDKTPVASAAYGVFQEHLTPDAAMRDKAALKLTSMKFARPAGPFYATVIEYPKGYPPSKCECKLFFSIGDPESG